MGFTLAFRKINDCENIKPEIIADSSKSIKYKINEELTPIEYTPEIGPSEYYTDKTKFTYSVNNLPQGVSASNNYGTLIISGTPKEEFSETTTVTISYPGADDVELSIDWKYIKPEITADSSKSIKYKINEELNTFNYTPEIGPSEYYTDKTKFTYSVDNLPQGVSARTENGTLIISGTPKEEFNETTTVTISYPNAEDKELSINWEVYVPKVRVSGFTGELSWMNSDYIINGKGEHGLEAYLPKNSDGYFDSENKIFGDMRFFISYLPDTDISQTHFGFGGIVYHKDYGDSMYFDAQRWVGIGW